MRVSASREITMRYQNNVHKNPYKFHLICYATNSHSTVNVRKSVKGQHGCLLRPLVDAPIIVCMPFWGLYMFRMLGFVLAVILIGSTTWVALYVSAHQACDSEVCE
jgi:hypothetical protein